MFFKNLKRYAKIRIHPIEHSTKEIDFQSLVMLLTHGICEKDAAGL